MNRTQGKQKPTIILLTSSPLTNRILIHTKLLSYLSVYFEIEIWTTSSNAEGWKKLGAPIKILPMPRVREGWGFITNHLRRINDHACTFALRNPSKLSIMRHLLDKKGGVNYQLQKEVGRAFAKLGMGKLLDQAVRSLVLKKATSDEAATRLRESRPVFIMSMGPHQHLEPYVINAAIQSGIPTGAYITSWDNLSTKNRLLHAYDAYFVWTQWMAEELRELEYGRKINIMVVGAPQYDVFFNDAFYMSREEFCAQEGLSPELPFIVAALGMANGIDESHLAEKVSEMVAAGELGDVQLLVRPHPYFHSDGTLRERLQKYGRRIKVQMRQDLAVPREERCDGEGDIRTWVNTFRHAAVVVHLCSTVAIDAAAFDVPSVCLDFDPTPGGERTELVKEINRVWSHYRRVVATGGMRLAGDWLEVRDALRAYLKDRSLDRIERRRMFETVAGPVDGRGSARLANAILAVSGGSEQIYQQGNAYFRPANG
jgi:hypothetical protein